MYRLTEFKNLMEQRLLQCNDPMSLPFGTDIFSDEAKLILHTRKRIYTDVLEQFPEPMKDHVFREEVNMLKHICLEYANSQQLRSRLAEFLKEFKEKCQ